VGIDKQQALTTAGVGVSSLCSVLLKRGIVALMLPSLCVSSGSSNGNHGSSSTAELRWWSLMLAMADII